MDVSSQHHVLAALPSGDNPGTHSVGGCLGPRAGPDVLKNRKFLSPGRIRTHGCGMFLSWRTQYLNHWRKLWNYAAQCSIKLSPYLLRRRCHCRVFLCNCWTSDFTSARQKWTGNEGQCRNRFVLYEIQFAVHMLLDERFEVNYKYGLDKGTVLGSSHVKDPIPRRDPQHLPPNSHPLNPHRQDTVHP
jgi:hypothetical protein